jgi:hypothetical protein
MISGEVKIQIKNPEQLAALEIIREASPSYALPIHTVHLATYLCPGLRLSF